MANPDTPAPALPRVRIAAHGVDNRGLEAAAPPGAGFGRFGRMFSAQGRLLPDSCLLAIATAVVKPRDLGVKIDVPEAVDENPLISAGYTYFGQFIDHDITLDTTPLKARGVDVAALTDFRTPAVDLDCVYGRGPDDQPYLYEADGLHLRLGADLDPPVAGAVQARRDVLRLDDPHGQPPPPGKGPKPAILGDKRNDENRIVVQIQAAFIAFHNKVVDDRVLIEAFDGIWDDPASRFRTAVDIVRWHYQWLVLHDYLRRVLEPNALSDILVAGGPPDLRHYQNGQVKWAYMPVEFAGAAYRFGHSMVRPSYALNGTVGADAALGTTGDEETSPQPPRLPVFSDGRQLENLNGFGFALPATWGIDWSFFFEIPRHAGTPQGFQLPQPSYRIDAQLVEPLAKLPEFREEGSTPSTSFLRNLAYRNLVRGVVNLRLPSGEQAARILGINALPPEVLWSAGSRTIYRPDDAGGWTRFNTDELATLLGEEDADELAETHARRQAVFNDWVVADGRLKGATPLWYYVLREAEFYGDSRKAEGPTAAFGGQHLGPVGSRIVGETFVGLLWNDEASFLRRFPGFRPHPSLAPAGDFTMADLLQYAL